MSQMPTDFPEPQKRGNPKKGNVPAKSQSPTSPPNKLLKKNRSKSPPKRKNVNPAKMELDESDDEQERKTASDSKMEELMRKYRELQNAMKSRERETDSLLRENELLAKELDTVQELMAMKEREELPLGQQAPVFGGRQLTATGAERTEEFERLESQMDPDVVRSAVGLSGKSDEQDEDGAMNLLSRLRQKHRRIAKLKKSEKMTINYNEALVRAAKATQLHVKMGQPGIPFNDRQVIAIANRGDAHGVAHLAMLIIARDFMNEGERNATEVAAQNPELALDILRTSWRDADNALALLSRGLSEDVLFFEQVQHVPEYQFILDQHNSSGRGTTDLLCDAAIEKMLQIVRSRANSTKQEIIFPPSVTFDESGRVVPQASSVQARPQQNEVIFGVTGVTAASGGYRPDSASRPQLDDDTTGEGEIRFCQFFQKKSGCKKATRCKYISGHYCAQCGARSHGAWKHASKSRYSPYKK